MGEYSNTSALQSHLNYINRIRGKRGACPDGKEIIGWLKSAIEKDNEQNPLREECKELWKNVYIAAIRSGEVTEIAEKIARYAVERYVKKFYEQENYL